MIIQLITIALSFGLYTSGAVASVSEPTIQQEIAAAQGALKGAREFIQSAKQKDFTVITQEQLGSAIEELAQDLRDRNDHVMADELTGKWIQTQLTLFSNMKDLGDHAPLLPWLEDFLQKLAGKYGTIILTLPIVADIRMLNFAIPVVFAPRGTWQVANADNRVEYRKHFIPFANIITYHAAKQGCLYVLNQNGLGQLKQLCGKVADKLKFVMGRYVAPVISDFIFQSLNVSTMNNAELELSDKDLVYTTAEQLLQAVRQEEQN